MATEVLIPKIGFAMNNGQINEWLIEDGYPGTEGQVIYVLEAEKSANQADAPAMGMLRILQPADTIDTVGTVVAKIE